MTTGEQGRTPPDAEHYLDLSGIEEDSPGPHFDVVLRGYDRRQVDEHVAGLRRMNAQLRAQLAVRERRRSAAPGRRRPRAGLEGRVSDTIPEARRSPGARARPVTPARRRPAAPTWSGAFNDRLRGILQAAEQEAQLVRSKAAESLLAEHAESRAALAELRAQRDAVVDELVRLRGRLDDIVSGPHAPRSAAPPAPPVPRPRGRGAVPRRPPGPPHPGPGRPGRTAGPRRCPAVPAPRLAGPADHASRRPPGDAEATSRRTPWRSTPPPSPTAPMARAPRTSRRRSSPPSPRSTSRRAPSPPTQRRGPAPSSPERAADG